MISKGEFIAIVGLINGMVGGSALVLPLLGLEAGYIAIPFISVFFGVVSAYSCLLTVEHLGECKNIRDSILEHFYGLHTVTVFYNFVMGMSLFIYLVQYSMLIIIQAEGLFSPSPWIPYSVYAVLLVLTIVMRYLHFGEKLLAIGIVSVLGYVGFLIWAHSSAPEGPNTFPSTGPKFMELAASLNIGYAIQDFIVQVLVNTTTANKFRRVIIVVYLSAICFYTYVTFGGIAILNRQAQVDEPQTIQQYFPRGGWQLNLIQIVFSIHLFTATPEFCIIMRIRFLQMFKIEDTQSITIKQLLIYVFAYVICFILHISDLKVVTVIEINGSIIGFMFVFLIPISVHWKCRFFSNYDQQGALLAQTTDQDGNVIQTKSHTGCRRDQSSRLKKTVELIIQILLMAAGAITMVYVMHSIIFEPETDSDIRPNPQKMQTSHEQSGYFEEY